MMPARYSGPGKSGVCVCGHKWDRHHLGVVLKPDYPEPYVPQECEYYGNNEMGGLTKDGRSHCHQYVDKGIS